MKRGGFGEIRSIQAEPDLYDFFVKIINHELARKDDVIVSCVSGDDLGGRDERKTTHSEGGGKRERTSSGKVSLCRGVLGGGIIRQIPSWALWTH